MQIKIAGKNPNVCKNISKLLYSLNTKKTHDWPPLPPQGTS